MKHFLSLFLISLICLISTSPNLVFATVGNEATEVIKGDINLDGKLDSEDIKLLKGVLLGGQELNSEQAEIADVNSDGIINIFDLSAQKNLLVKTKGENIEYSVLENKWIQGNDSPYDNQNEILTAQSLTELYSLIKTAENYAPKDIEDIDESFFENKMVIVMYSTVGASNRLMVIDEVVKKHDSLTVYTTTTIPEFPTPDMAYRRIILAIDRADFEGVVGVCHIENTTTN